MAHNVLSQLNELKFGDQVLLFGGGGALVTVLPLLILLSAFASRRFDHGIAVHLGLDRRAADVASRLFTSSPATLNADTVTSLVIVGVGAVAITSSIRQIYEKIFHQHHRGLPFLWRRLSWVGVMCVVVALETTTADAARNAVPGEWLVDLVTFAFYAPFFWWTMHFLLGGKVGWRGLAPSAVATGLCFVALAVPSRFYFSPTIVSDNTVYGPLATVFGLMTWLAGIGGAVVVGAVLGAAWEGRNRPGEVEGTPAQT